MKLLLITNLFPVPWDEHRAAFNRQQITRLSKLHDIDVIVPVSNRNWFKYKNIDLTNYISSLNIRIIPFFYMPGLFRFIQSFSLFFSLLFKIKSLRKQNYDCVLAYWAYPDAVSAILLSRILKKKVIIKVFGSDVLVFFKDKTRKRQIVWAMNQSSKVISVSKDIKKKLVESGVAAEKIQVLYDGVDKTIFNYKDRMHCRNLCGIKQDSLVILFVGNIITTKGINELYDAFKLLANKYDQLELHFVGDGNIVPIIQKYSKTDNLSHRVIFHGKQPLPRVSEILSASNLLCLPSYSEGVPNVLLEAKACGIPVVATDVGGIAEVVNSNDGMLIPAKNVNHLADGLDDCLSREWDSKLITQGADRYSWEENVSILDMEIQSLN